MNEFQTLFALSCRSPGDPAPSLVRVDAQARLDAVLFELTLRQTYRNTSTRVLEVVYTFPLPPLAVLLGFAAELNGARQEGVVVARPEAEQRYESALAEGDAPVMLEAHAEGLHTANIGNLAPGDELVLECRFAQLLHFEQGRLRVAIPGTIAPRYGQAHGSGLQAQQVPVATLDADYPLSLSLTIGEALAGAEISCPTHRVETRRTPGGETRLDISPGAKLDRDLVLLIAPREPRPSLLVRASDSRNPAAPVVMLAALQPPLGVARERVALKLLVDCSGSMNGDSLASARAALRGVIARLGEQDELSLSRFGSQVEHACLPSAAGPRTLQRLHTLIEGLQADLGGTEMQVALESVFALRCSGARQAADVLLITDGQIWQADPLIAAARASGHRVFALGVGAAPAEGLLRALADATGGACEFATPGEALEAAAQRMLQRLRQPALGNDLRIDWGAEPIWSSGPARSLFGGDTVIALAGFRHPIEAGAVRLLATDAQGRTLELARAEADAPCPGDRLPRIAAAHRLREGAVSDAPALALQYQLMSEHTNCILVHQRAEADKPGRPAELQRLGSMLAAGWGGTGSVAVDAFAAPLAACAAPSFEQVIKHSFAPAFFDSLSLFGGQAAPAGTTLEKPAPATLRDIAETVKQCLATSGRVEALAACDRSLVDYIDARRAMNDAYQLGLDVAEAWLLLAHWVNQRPQGLADAALAALLKPWVEAIDPDLVAAVTAVFERHLGGHPIDGWQASRAQRLQQAMGLEPRALRARRHKAV